MRMNFARHANAIARALLGDPNKALSSKTTLRYGTNGSLAVEIAGERAGTWHDHEHGVGGGMMALIRRKKGFSNGAALDWLKDIGIAVRAPKQKVMATYIYHDQSGQPVYKIIRKGPKKQFFQARYDATTNDYVSGTGCMEGVRRVPYRLNEWADAEGVILIPEGEKDVDRLWSLKFLATCNAGGAGKWSRGFSPYFTGREVIIIPDNDQAGRDHAREIADCLMPVASRVAILELPGLADKSDASDWLDVGHTADELRELIEKAPEAASVMEGWAPPEPKSNGHDKRKGDRPLIRVTQGALHELVDTSHGLLAQASPDLFQYGGQLSHTVRVTKTVKH
jgi:putative DNA primase/helicase